MSLWNSFWRWVWRPVTPSLVVESVGDVDPKVLRACGITAIITDLDNTLVPWRRYEITPGVIEWLERLEVEGIKICIASNTLHMQRLKQLADTMAIPFVDRVRKPFVGGFIRSMEAMESTRATTAVFGDQLFTDVWCGNKLGLTTILLRPPLSREEFFWTQVVRYIENAVIRCLRQLGQWPAVRRLEEALDSIPDPRSPAGQRLTKSVLLVPAIFLAIIAAIVVYTLRGRKS
ncbi:MAG: YqeG family HAD IIIA-type phosphatase [Capsulimonadaceae bacterium]